MMTQGPGKLPLTIEQQQPHVPLPIMATPFPYSLLLIIIGLTFLPCFINLFQRFLQERITVISNATTKEQFKTLLLLEAMHLPSPHFTPNQQEVVR
jgi:hypothetical protein